MNTQDYIKQANDAATNQATIERVDGTDDQPCGFHKSQFNGAPMRVTIEPRQWIVGQGKGLLIDGEWRLLSFDELGSALADFGNTPLTFELPTDDLNTGWITLSDIKKGFLDSANQRLQSLAPSNDACDWRIKTIEVYADPEHAFYTFTRDGVDHQLPLS